VKYKKENRMLHFQAGEKLTVVGIGASAGGLEALLSLLPYMRPTGRITYIISQHMAQNAHSALMVQLLGRVSPLPVTQALPDEKLLPDHIYLIPPGRNGVVESGHIRLQLPQPHMLSSPSVDVLFSSIAENCKNFGIGVIVSGTGSDGTAGCRAIKSHGGTTFAQDPHAAVYSGMPSSAIEAGVVDCVVREQEIPEAIIARSQAGKSTRAAAAAQTEKSPMNMAAPDELALGKILQLVTRSTGTDFSGYKEETLQRRLEKRLALLKIPTLQEYLEHLRAHPAELVNLQHAFLVTLSSFFRDHAAFHALEQHLRRLLESKQPGDEIRVWVPGCATGEEVYTLAIILSEILAARAHQFAISIVGSDLNPEAIPPASRGLYKQNALKEIDPVLLERYFERKRGGWQVKATLQAMCRFECCDVLRREPLQGLDLISCRNLLIYLKVDAQARLFRKFHECLRPQGLLFLGQSETAGTSGQALFAPLDSYYRIFERPHFDVAKLDSRAAKQE
jgi:chemotaxis methyl-accepting protein methylase